MTGLLPREEPIAWETDERSVVVASRSTIPAVVHRVDLATGQRTKIGEYAPASRTGLLLVRPTVYRDNGRQHAYDYYRRVSKVFLVRAPRDGVALNQRAFSIPLSASHSSNRAFHAPTGRLLLERRPKPWPPLP